VRLLGWSTSDHSARPRRDGTHRQEMTVTSQELAGKIEELIREARQGGLCEEKIIEELAEAAQVLEEGLS
jgi:hypothetical protein